MRLELTRVGLLVELANHYTTRGAPMDFVTIFMAFSDILNSFQTSYHQSLRGSVEIIIIIITFILLVFLTPVLAGGFSLEFKCQQVSSTLHDSSQSSGRS